MDFFNKTKESLKNAGSALSQKANGVSGTVTMTMKIKETEKTIKECYAEAARIMVDEHFEQLQEICPELCQRILDARKQLEKEKKELAICKGLQICPNCGSEESQEVICCTKCGTNIQEASRYLADMEEETTNAEPVNHFCPNCGNQITENSLFCPNCGNKL